MLGAILGAIFGAHRGGILGALMGGALGHFLEEGLRDSASAKGAKATYSRLQDSKRSSVFYATAAAMLAKLAKADGHVSRFEINAVEAAFVRLGFSAQARQFAIEVFTRAKSDPHTIYEYAREFVAVVRSLAVRELFYELLWDLACSDGTVSPEELAILRNMTAALKINPNWFDRFAYERLSRSQQAGAHYERPQASTDELAQAFALLEATPGMSDEALRKAYRNMAKKYHPDTLRAKGLPEEMIGKATEMMARVNAAWDRICQARGMK